MAVMSALRSCLSPNVLRNGPFQLKKLYFEQSRFMSEKRIFPITASRFQWNKFKDSFHFYTLLGVIPIGTLVLFVNIFIGNGELAEIPERYEPKHWEYYPHPIQRFFARYIYPNPQQVYEKNMHVLNEENEKIKWREIEKKVKELMAHRDDYRGWYFIPIEGKYHRHTLKEEHLLEDRRGFNASISNE